MTLSSQTSEHCAYYDSHHDHCHTDEREDVFWTMADSLVFGWEVVYCWGEVAGGGDAVARGGVGRWLDWFVLVVSLGFC
jgi:hypothetical protein